MSRKGVIEITSDLSGKTFYAADDGSTSEPLTVTVGTGENAVTYVLDYMPNEKSAFTDMLAGNREPMTDILVSLKPKVVRANSDDEETKEVANWYKNARTDGKAGELPGRVTKQMRELYATRNAARDAAAKADAANAANAANASDGDGDGDGDGESRTPQSRRQRNAARDAA